MKPVLHSFAYCLDYLREQVEELDSKDMIKQPSGIMNHPAWVVGHLTYSCQAIGGEVGLSEWLPRDFALKFGTGSTPISDLHAYLSKEESLEFLRQAQTRIVDAICQLTDKQLDAPLPDENYRRILPTVRHAITQVLLSHPAYHVGQVTLWRQAMGLPKLQRPFA